MKRILILLVPAVFVLGACAAAGSSSSPATGSTDTSMGAMGHGSDAGTGGFGEPGDVSSVDRTIDVQLNDSLAFDPPSLHVDSGETIRFRVLNDGATAHEFVLGDEATQQEHAAAMGGGPMPMHEANYLAVAPGQTRSIVWTFTEPGIVLYACHVPGHYAGGMVGSIMVM
jgi:uncharacterized cupredoxin-like copper-binding protein